jgi:hypothetical protein
LAAQAIEFWGWDVGGFMPYIAGVGPAVEFVEAALNGDGSAQHKLDALVALEAAPQPSWLDATLTIVGNTAAVGAFINHVNTDWFGMTQNLNGAWQPQRPYDANANPTTGFWDGWYVADASDIMRTALINILKLALGIDASGNSTRNDRIVMLWICTEDAFQMVVRRWSGTVLGVFVTPGVANSPVTNDLAAGPFNGHTNYACPPTDFSVKRAVHITGDRYTMGDYDAYVTGGPVTVVQLAAEDGGAH